MSGANYKVASFKRSYNGNQKGDLFGRQVSKQKALPSWTFPTLLTQLKNYCKSKVSAKFRFGTFLSFMKRFDHFWTNHFSTKAGFKKFSTRLKLHVWNPKASHTLLDFPQKCFYELSGLSKEGLQKFKRTDKKSDQDFHID